MCFTFYYKSRTTSITMNDTPRGSWASSIFDLRNSQSDPMLPNLLERINPEEMDQHNLAQRHLNRQDVIFSLYPNQPVVSVEQTGTNLDILDCIVNLEYRYRFVVQVTSILILYRIESQKYPKTKMGLTVATKTLRTCLQIRDHFFSCVPHTFRMNRYSADKEHRYLLNTLVTKYSSNVFN